MQQSKKLSYHVVKIDEGIVDGDDLDVLVGKSSAEDETTNASESRQVCTSRKRRGTCQPIVSRFV